MTMSKVPVLLVYPRFSGIVLKKKHSIILLFINSSHMYQNGLGQFFYVFEKERLHVSVKDKILT